MRVNNTNKENAPLKGCKIFINRHEPYQHLNLCSRPFYEMIIGECDERIFNCEDEAYYSIRQDVQTKVDKQYSKPNELASLIKNACHPLDHQYLAKALKNNKNHSLLLDCYIQMCTITPKHDQTARKTLNDFADLVADKMTDENRDTHPSRFNELMGAVNDRYQQEILTKAATSFYPLYQKQYHQRYQCLYELNNIVANSKQDISHISHCFYEKFVTGKTDDVFNYQYLSVLHNELNINPMYRWEQINQELDQKRQQSNEKSKIFRKGVWITAVVGCVLASAAIITPMLAPVLTPGIIASMAGVFGVTAGSMHTVSIFSGATAAIITGVVSSVRVGYLVSKQSAEIKNSQQCQSHINFINNYRQLGEGLFAHRAPQADQSNNWYNQVKHSSEPGNDYSVTHMKYDNSLQFE